MMTVHHNVYIKILEIQLRSKGTTRTILGTQIKNVAISHRKNKTKQSTQTSISCDPFIVSWRGETWRFVTDGIKKKRRSHKSVYTPLWRQPGRGRGRGRRVGCTGHRFALNTFLLKEERSYSSALLHFPRGYDDLSQTKVLRTGRVCSVECISHTKKNQRK